MSLPPKVHWFYDREVCKDEKNLLNYLKPRDWVNE